MQLVNVRNGERITIEVDNFFDGVEYLPHVIIFRVEEIKGGRCKIVIEGDATMRQKTRLPPK